MPASGQEATNYVELICHLGAYSSVLTLVNGFSADQLDRLSKAVREMYPADSILIHASSLGLGYSIEQRLAEYFQLPPSVPGLALRKALIQRAEQTVASGDPVLVVLERGDLMTLDQLREASNLSLLAPHVMSFCILGMDDFDRGLGTQKNLAHLYRIRLREPVHSVDAPDFGRNDMPDMADLAFAADSPERHEGLETASSVSPQGGFIASMQERLADFIPGGETQSSQVVSAKGFPMLHMVALALVILILVISLLDLAFDDEAHAPVPPPVTPVEVRSLEIAERPVMSSDSAFKEDAIPTPATHLSPKELAEFPVTTPTAKASNGADKYRLVETSPTGEVKSSSQGKATVSEPRLPSIAKPQSVKPSSPLAGDGYLVQLMASEDPVSAQAFISRWKEAVPGHLYHQQTTRKGQVWYIVFMAPYTSWEAASSDVALLPSQLKRQKPWIRSTADVRKIVSG